MPWQYYSEIDAFTIYHKVQEEREKAEHEDDFAVGPAFGHALAGALGTMASNIIVYPLDLVITRMQCQQRSEPLEDTGDSDKYTGLRDAAAKIYKHEGGIAAFYSGITQDTMKSAVDSFLFFFSYNFLSRARKQMLSNPTKLSFLDDIAVGMIAGAFTKGVTAPIQQIVTRKQTTAPGDKQPSARDITHQIMRTQGIQGFWSGYSATLILTLNPSLTFFIDDLLKKLMRAGETSSSAPTFLAAACAKAIASTITYPVSLAKTRAQASSANASDDKSKKKSAGPGGVVMTIPAMAKADGIGALYAGLSGEILKGFLSHGLTMLVKSKIHGLVIKLYFMLLDTMKQYRRRNVLKVR